MQKLVWVDRDQVKEQLITFRLISKEVRGEIDVAIDLQRGAGEEEHRLLFDPGLQFYGECGVGLGHRVLSPGLWIA